MAPIRVGFMGLPATGPTGGLGAWGVRAHLPGLLKSPHYEITAVSNSTVESSKAAIAAHDLGSSVKAYRAEDIVNDPDVDLIVCSATFTKHYELLKPAILAGKDIFVEWPIVGNLKETEELTELAKSKNVKTMVGAQARADPLVGKLKELIDGGKIGKVTSSIVTGIFHFFPVWPESMKFFADENSGCTNVTVVFGHFLDSFIHVLGNFESVNSVLAIDTTSFKIKRDDGTTYDSPKTTSDTAFLQGKLASGAVASINFRHAFGDAVDNVRLRWLITGTEGEIEVTDPTPMWQFGAPDRKLTFRATGGEAESIDFTSVEEEYVSSLPFPAPNTARVLDAFAKGDTDKYADFEKALETYRVVDKLRAQRL